ncbi:asparaginase, partial [Candidatus Poribacteria bacterium]|nr:asparaginase [Candidatus Poribacteria bacterium]
EGLDKPVVLTGSLIPLCEVRNDARENLIAAMLIAGNFAIPEVCLYFGNKLLRGCRAKKVNATGFDAFASPNFPPLGRAGMDIEVRWDLVLPPSGPAGRLVVQDVAGPVVGAHRLFPGFPAAVMANVLKPPLRGLVLETFGVGNGPSRDHALLGVLAEAVARGVVIVNCTQCLAGTVDMRDYSTGSALARAGLISGHDMTAEAALAKLHYLFATGHSTEDTKRLMAKSSHGELTGEVDATSSE